MAALRRSEPELTVAGGQAAGAPAPPAAHPRPRLTRIVWPIAAALAGAAASTLVTAGAAEVAGHQADLALDPVELALRVGLLLAAPCVGALLAALVLPSGGGRPAIAGVAVGVPFGPLLVLRLDRMRDFGLGPTLLTAAVLVLWGVIGALLVAGWWARPARTAPVERTRLPPLPGPRVEAEPPEPRTHPSPDPGPDAGGAA
jgi:hypothetical protein